MDLTTYFARRNEVCSATVQAKVKPSEQARLDKLVQDLRDQGLSVTRSSVVRSILLGYFDSLDQPS